MTAAYGVEGFTEEMEDSARPGEGGAGVDRQAGTRRGDRGATKVAERLMARGVECLRVNFPHGQDANEYALKVMPPSKSLGVLLKAAVWMGRHSVAVTTSDASRAPSFSLVAAKELAASPAATPNPEAAKDERPAEPSLALRREHWFLTIDGREYRLGGLEKTAGTDALKVALRLRVSERFHLDQIDLARDADRRRFAERAAEETGLTLPKSSSAISEKCFWRWSRRRRKWHGRVWKKQISPVVTLTEGRAGGRRSPG